MIINTYVIKVIIKTTERRRRRKKNPFFSVTSFFPIDLSFDLVLTSKEKKNGDVEGFVKVNLNETKDVEAILNVR